MMRTCPKALPLLAAIAAIAAVAVPIGAPADTDTFRAAALQHGAQATDPAHAGIWKAATPPAGTLQGEFDGDDPIGLSAGVRIKADCSINWVDPDSRKRYCFSSATSLVVFLDAPHAYLTRALHNWDRPTSDAPR